MEKAQNAALDWLRYRTGGTSTFHHEPYSKMFEMCGGVGSETKLFTFLHRCRGKSPLMLLVYISVLRTLSFLVIDYTSTNILLGVSGALIFVYLFSRKRY